MVFQEMDEYVWCSRPSQTHLPSQLHPKAAAEAVSEFNWTSYHQHLRQGLILFLIRSPEQNEN